MTLGEDISLNLNGKIFNYDINKIIDSINVNKNNFIYEQIKFNIPRKIYYETKFDCLIDNFESFMLNGKEKKINNYSFNEKKVIFQNLLGFDLQEFLKIAFTYHLTGSHYGMGHSIFKHLF